MSKRSRSIVLCGGGVELQIAVVLFLTPASDLLNNPFSSLTDYLSVCHFIISSLFILCSNWNDLRYARTYLYLTSPIGPTLRRRTETCKSS